MKKAIYSMHVNALDTLTANVTLSKKQFDAQFQHLIKQVQDTSTVEEEGFKAKFFQERSEHDNRIETEYVFCVGTTDIVLRSLVCKPGYAFKQ